LKLFLIVNVDWFFLSHRLPIALEAKQKGYQVTVFAIEEAGKGDYIRSLGFRFIPLPTSRSGTNFLQELQVLWFLSRWYRKEKPDVVHHVAVKPVTYGSVAAKLTKVPKVVNALSGLGFLFINAGKNPIVHYLVTLGFKYGFRNRNLHFILQNKDDYEMIKKIGVLKDEQLTIIKGSGVDLDEYQFTLEKTIDAIQVMLPARMLWDKGVGEFVEAAIQLKHRFKKQVNFILAGGIDTGNRAAISKAQLEEWYESGVIEWIGHQEDMKNIYMASHIVVLPSYREGLPKALIEACAIGRAIVTTDVPGCREVVDDGINGLLVPVKNVVALAAAIEKLILQPKLRQEMGKRGREKAEAEFSLKDVIEKTFAIYEA
jgi:glycosyltransferase involved in cell wall biosynthesis